MRTKIENARIRKVILQDPFGGYFDQHTDEPHPEKLMSSHLAERWMKEISWGRELGLYTYQQAPDGCNGAHITRQGQPLLMLSSYDYLSLIGNEQINKAAVEAIARYGTGTGGVRLLTGTSEIHAELELQLAKFLRKEASVTFTSGYAANISVIVACMGPRDLAIVDEFAHQSVHDGVRLAGARHRKFHHNDIGHLREILFEEAPANRTLIIVDGLYSMDGDVCALEEIVEVKNQFGAALMVDEAHSLGVLGKTGRGTCEHYSIPPEEIDLMTGSLSKAIPSNGGFVAASKEMSIYLNHSARGFIFSGALAPPAAAAAIESLNIIEREPERLTNLWHAGTKLREGLQRIGYETGDSNSPLVPVITGSNESAYRLARSLLDQGIVATPITYPAVKPNAARLRLCASAAHTDQDIEAALLAFQRAENR